MSVLSSRDQGHRTDRCRCIRSAQAASAELSEWSPAERRRRRHRGIVFVFCVCIFVAPCTMDKAQSKASKYANQCKCAPHPPLHSPANAYTYGAYSIIIVCDMCYVNVLPTMYMHASCVKCVLCALSNRRLECGDPWHFRHTHIIGYICILGLLIIIIIICACAYFYIEYI